MKTIGHLSDYFTASSLFRSILCITFASALIFPSLYGQNIGIGTVTPGQKLEVAGNIKLGDNIMIEGSTGIKVYRNLASYYDNISPFTGAFVVHTNQPGYDSEFAMTIQLYKFDPYGMCEVTIGGYTGTSEFGYMSEGDFDLEVRIAQDLSGNIVIILGDVATAYNYPKLTVTEFRQSWANLDEAYADGWSITQETSLDAYSSVTDVPDASLWHSAGTDIYYTAGDVGIGTSTPNYPLHVQINNSASYADAAHFVNLGSGTGSYMNGIYSESRSTATSNPGAGVYGYHYATTGTSAGVTGESNCPTGKGVFGKASSATGVNYGVYGKTSSSSGYAGYFEGAQNYFSGMVGIGTENPAASLDIFGGEAIIRLLGAGHKSIDLVKPFILFPFPDWRIENNDDLMFWSASDDFVTDPTDGYMMSYSQDFFGPIVDVTKSCGRSTHRWTSIWASNGTIQTSDYNEKQEITRLNYGLNEVMQMNPISFRWKCNPDEGIHLGLIAQEVEPILPEVIVKETDSKSGREIYGMNYSQIIPVLIKAIQEQQQEIGRLQHRIEELEKEQ